MWRDTLTRQRFERVNLSDVKEVSGMERIERIEKIINPWRSEYIVKINAADYAINHSVIIMFAHLSYFAYYWALSHTTKVGKHANMEIS